MGHILPAGLRFRIVGPAGGSAAEGLQPLRDALLAKGTAPAAGGVGWRTGYAGKQGSGGAAGGMGDIL